MRLGIQSAGGVKLTKARPPKHRIPMEYGPNAPTFSCAPHRHHHGFGALLKRSSPALGWRISRREIR